MWMAELLDSVFWLAVIAFVVIGLTVATNTKRK